MRVGVPRETAPLERRVAIVPADVGRLAKAGVTVQVERGAGAASFIPDTQYEAAGASVVDDAWAGADLVAKVQRPTLDEVRRLRSGAALVAFLQPSASGEVLQALAAQGVSALAMELVPRITRAQAMDALSSQANIAGYKAVLLAAAASPRLLPMLTTAAGTISPAKAFVVGAGVAGLQAIATARRLGAVVSAFDVRPVVKEQVQSLGARFLEVENVAAEGAGGYARELAAEQQQRVEEAIAAHIREQDLVVTTAQVPGRPAPRIVTEAMVHAMKPGAVLVDLAAESGGNCALTKAGETVVAGGVTILGPVNVPSSVAQHASQLYSRNVQQLLAHLVVDGQLRLDLADEITGPMTVTHGGAVRLGA